MCSNRTEIRPVSGFLGLEMNDGKKGKIKNVHTEMFVGTGYIHYVAM